MRKFSSVDPDRIVDFSTAERTLTRLKEASRQRANAATCSSQHIAINVKSPDVITGDLTFMFYGW